MLHLPVVDQISRPVASVRYQPFSIRNKLSRGAVRAIQVQMDFRDQIVAGNSDRISSDANENMKVLLRITSSANI